MSRIGPAEGGQRDRTLDILRGAAVLGLLLSNMEMFSMPLAGLLLPSLRRLATRADIAAHLFRTFAIDLKSLSLFAFLFGAGIAMRERRWQEAQASFAPLYRRWLSALAFIGLLHGALLWYGDILLVYAVIGGIAAGLRGLRPRDLVFAALALLALNGLLVTGAILGGGSMTHFGAPGNPYAVVGRLYRREMLVYSSGSYAAVASLRLFMFLRCVPAALLVLGGRLLALFLLGIWAIRTGLLAKMSREPALLSRAAGWGFLTGIPLEALAVWLQAHAKTDPPSLAALWFCHYFGSLGLALGLFSALCGLCVRPLWQERLRPLAEVGRMTLTNYVLQSAVCTAIFYPYGLGLFGKVGPAQGLALALAIYIVQCLFSVWWLKRFRFGPLEWIARIWTYGGVSLSLGTGRGERAA